MVLNAFWKTQTDNYFIRMGPLGLLIHSQLWVLLILSRYWPLTVQSWFPETLMSPLLLYTSVSFLYPGCYCVPIIMYWDLFAALVLYDYTLTISREIELFWKRSRRPWTFALFIANRYIAILGHAPFLVYSFWSPESQSDYRVSNVSWFIPYSDMQPPFFDISGELVPTCSSVGFSLT